MGYHLFAYVPIRPGFFGPGTFRLIPLDLPAFSGHSTKMIFLVPARLQAEFEREAAR
jgi:hypothetical protein